MTGAQYLLVVTIPSNHLMLANQSLQHLLTRRVAGPGMVGMGACLDTCQPLMGSTPWGQWLLILCSGAPY